MWLHYSPSARAANSHSSENVSSHSYRNVLLLVPLRVTRLPSRIHILRLYILLSPVFTFSFPSYIFFIVTSCLTFSLIFYLILSFFARLATHASLASLIFSPYPHVSYLFSTLIHFFFLNFYTFFIHSLFPLPLRLPFLSHLFHSHFHFCSSSLSLALLSLLTLSISVIHSSPLPSSRIFICKAHNFAK